MSFTASSEPVLSKRHLSIVPADNVVRIEAARELFREYAAALSFDLCFQGFEEELAGLPGEYAPWSGMLLLGLVDDQLAGCVALRRIEGEAGGHGALFGGSDVCEMKRLYVRPDYRGCGLGRVLVDAILNCASAIGYRAMRLDTVPSEMGAAVAMYRTFGFVEIPPYRNNPIAGAKYMELDLKNRQKEL
jgi:putative acetyltransferase